MRKSAVYRIKMIVAVLGFIGLLGARPAHALTASEAVERVRSFDWASFIARVKPASVRITGIYVGGANGYSFNDDEIAFRPASVEKVFTATAYAHYRGWDPVLVPMLKRSLNGVADGTVAPAVGLEKIEDYVNAEIETARARAGLRRDTVRLVDEKTGARYVVDPFRVQCESGSGLDGAVSGQNRSFARRSYVTVLGLRLFLEQIVGEPYFDRFVRALPFAGIDGTLGRRLKGQARGSVAAKTGTLADVANLAGYVHTLDGNGMSQWIPFVVLTQGRSVAEARLYVDAIVEQVATLTESVPIPPMDNGDLPNPKYAF